jgi:AbrB family looped-hinge helix DNA binding protein
MKIKIDSRGRITLPKAVRDRLGVERGGMVEFQVDQHGRIVMIAAGSRLPKSQFAALRGRAGPGLSTDQILAMTRGYDGL